MKLKGSRGHNLKRWDSEVSITRDLGHPALSGSERRDPGYPAWRAQALPGEASLIRRIRIVGRRIVVPVVAVIRVVGIRPRGVPVRVVPPGIPAERPARSPIAAPVGPSDAEAPTTPAPTITTPAASPAFTMPTEARTPEPFAGETGAGS